jgi:hypothetical protein
MTVKELIEQLAKYPANMDVRVLIEGEHHNLVDEVIPTQLHGQKPIVELETEYCGYDH